MKIIAAALYIWLTIIFLWRGRYSRTGIGERPLILGSVIFQFLFNLLSLAWIVITFYVLFFVNWKFVVLTFLLIFITRFFASLTGLLETIALWPISVAYFKLNKVVKKQPKENDQTKDS